MEEKKSGFGTAGLVLGIIGACTSFIPIVNNASFVLGVIGAIFAIISLAKKASKGQAIAGVILCVLAIFFTINSQKALMTSLNEVSAGISNVSSDLDKAIGNSTEDVLQNDVKVELGKFEVTKEKYGITNTKLTVKVTNKTTEKKSFTIHIEAVSSSGERIDDGYVYANDLNAGQSQNFDIFTLVSSENVSKLKNATFKIVEASMF